MSTPLQPRKGEYTLVRHSAGLKPVHQRNTVAPARRGMWAFFAGTQHKADNVPRRVGARWHTFTVPASKLIYVGWDSHGKLTHDGFFNVGDWQLVTAEEAAASLRRHINWVRGYATGRSGDDTRWRWYTDAASFQVFVPA